MGKLIRLSLFLLLAAIPSGIALAQSAMLSELVCDPPDFTLRGGERHSVELDSGAGSLEFALAVDFPKKALQSRAATASVTFLTQDGLPAYSAAISLAEDPSLAGFNELALRLTVDSVSPGGLRLGLLDTCVNRNVNLAGGINCLIVNVEKGCAKFYAGGSKMNYAGEVEMNAPIAAAELTVNTTMTIKRLAIRQGADPAKYFMTSWTMETLAARFAASDDPLEGFWGFLDRDNDPKWAIPGGFYELAVVRSDTIPGAYDIIYLSGATVNGRAWHQGMRKGSLTPTIFADHYLLSWVDSRFLTDYSECTADISTENTILTLNFPLHHSQLRFSRRPELR